MEKTSKIKSPGTESCENIDIMCIRKQMIVIIITAIKRIQLHTVSISIYMGCTNMYSNTLHYANLHMTASLTTLSKEK